MKYPYIGEAKNGNVILLFTEKEGVVLDAHQTIVGTSGGWNEDKFKNITAEYLANTYGEVKSKEHAHFILELGEGAGYELVGSVSPNRAGVFVFDGENKTLFFMLGGGSLRGGSVLKQITIPLPPECESVDEWPVVGSSVEWGHTGKGEVKSLSDGFAWVKLDNKDYTTVYVSSLRKPKTPEQELRDDLHTHFEKYTFVDQAINELTIKYSITKKGEGDE